MSRPVGLRLNFFKEIERSILGYSKKNYFKFFQTPLMKKNPITKDILDTRTCIAKNEL